LAHLGVGDADHRDVERRWVSEEYVLDLLRIDLHAAGDDGVRHPVGEVEVAIDVQVADVPGAPALRAVAGGGLLRVV
jgi:hypothetical protein